MNVPKLRFKEFNDDATEYNLEDVVDFLDDRRKPIKDSDRNNIKGDYPYYGASGIIDYINDYIFDEPLLLIGEDGANIVSRSTKLVFQANGKYWVNNHAHVLRTKKNFDINYLENYLENINYEPYNTGTAQPKLNQEVCRKIKLNLPKYDEQIKIGKLLKLLDKKIELQSKKIEDLKLFKKGLRDLLINNLEKYDLKQMSEIGFIYNGLSGKSKDDFENGDSKYITFMSVLNNNILESNLGIVNVKNNEKQNVVKKGDIIFNGTSETKEEVGLCSCCNITLNNLYLNSFCFGFRLFESVNYNPEYICDLLLSTQYRKKISDLGQGFTRVNLSKLQLMKIDLKLPSIDIQDKISNVSKKMKVYISLEEYKLNKLNELKKGLMQNMFV